MRPNRYSLPALAALLTLAFALPAQAQYGTGTVIQVPHATGPITLDGDDNEAAWDNATEVELTDNWDSGWFDCCGDPDIPDVASTAKLLWDDGALYVYVRQQHSAEHYWGSPGAPYEGSQLLVGIDLTHSNDEVTDDSWGGFVDYMPELGTYKVSGQEGVGITADWGFSGLDPVAEGYVDGTVFVDDANLEWGVEMVIYGDQVASGADLGFNIGGSVASPESADECGDECGDPNYAYFSWQVCDGGPGTFFCGPGGTVMSDAHSFATLSLVQTVANEPGATASEGYDLRASGPNPFRGTTALTYTLPQAAQVSLAVYDVLGRQVAVLDSGARAAGDHRATFDASALPAGVYTARLTADGAPVATRRVMQVH